MTFANSIPDCVPVAQRQGDDEDSKDHCFVRLWSPQHSSPCVAPSCQHTSHDGTEALQLETAVWSEKGQLCTHHGLHRGCEQQPGRGQSGPDVIFHTENTLLKGGSEQHTGRGCVMGTQQILGNLLPG